MTTTELKILEIDTTLLNRIGFDRLTFNIPLSAPGVVIPGSAISESSVLKTKRLEIPRYIETPGSTEFYYKLSENHRTKEESLKLELVPGRILYNTSHNAYCVPADKIVGVIETVLRELKDEHSIIIPIDALSLASMEINNTVDVLEDLKKYEDMLKYVFGGRVKTDTRDNHNSFTLVASTVRQKNKFYDKSSQIKNDLKLYPTVKMARFEITLSRPDSILAKFGTLKIQDIQQMDIEALFSEEVKRLENNLFKYILEDAKILYDFFKERECKPGFRPIDVVFKEFNAKKMAISETQLPFWQIPYIAMKKLYKEYENKNVRRDCIKVVGKDSIPLFNNLEMLLKLLIKFSPSEEKREKEKQLQSKLDQCLKLTF